MPTTFDAAARGETLTFEQHVSLRDFVGLSFRNGLLNLVTLTLYRFWGKTEVRRRVWSATFINGEALEYTGRGVELFKGFLFALLALGLPFLLISFGAQLLGPVMAAIIILPFYLLVFFLFGFGMFTAFRYMASRTVWRGVRFALKGSASEYAWSYIGYMMLSGVTLGWYAPTAARHLAAPLWGGLHFGDLPLRFDMAAARRERIYPAFAVAWLGGLLAYVVIILTVFAIGYAARDTGNGTNDLTFLMILLGVILLSPVFILALAPYRAAVLRSVAAGVRIGDAAFRLELKWPQMAWLMFTNFGLAIVSIGLLAPLIQARTTRFMVSRLRSEGVVDLSAVRQAERGPKTAEGLADAFGMAPI